MKRYQEPVGLKTWDQDGNRSRQEYGLNGAGERTRYARSLLTSGWQE